MIHYWDASGLGSLTMRDQRWEELEALIATGNPCALSDFGWGELISAVALRVRRGDATPDDAQSFIGKAEAFTADWSRLRIRSEDIAAATGFVRLFDLKLRLPDAIHVAVAKRLGATLVTGDHRQAIAAVSLGIAVHPAMSGKAP